ncbi:hypothetical protein C2845_PM03G18440 [Panicum miliaceum]|uniref:Uncharacterized protein n=1 Tax=Panicum miliaceum TaxID=4540 RepID=A0A3L6T4Y6_PANMI|nr:hypothetical protein C2845_PM03G18440 [Panicum miliaceum]
MEHHRSTSRSGRRGAAAGWVDSGGGMGKEWTLEGEESYEDGKGLGAMDVDLKDEGNGTDGLRPMHQHRAACHCPLPSGRSCWCREE